MINRSLEAFVQSVREAHEQVGMPVDPIAIAKGERICLAPSHSYGTNFEGRLEYHVSPRKWILFFKTKSSGSLTRRGRFTLAHELGHFFLETHRELYLNGASHSSTLGYISDNIMERQADEFAGALLLPADYLERRLDKREYMSLREIMKMSDEWDISLQSAVIRYVEFTGERCMAVVAKDGAVRYCVSSDGAKGSAMRWAKIIPEASITHEIISARTLDTYGERSVSASEWISFHSGEFHEECIFMSDWGLSITLLSMP